MRWKFWRCAKPADPVLARMEHALQGMDAVTREVFLLHRLDSLGYPEIAERLSISVAEVQEHIAQAMSGLVRASSGD